MMPLAVIPSMIFARWRLALARLQACNAWLPLGLDCGAARCGWPCGAAGRGGTAGCAAARRRRAGLSSGWRAAQRGGARVGCKREEWQGEFGRPCRCRPTLLAGVNTRLRARMSDQASPARQGGSPGLRRTRS